MSDSSDFDQLALAPGYDADHPPPPDAARALLDECFVRFRRELIDAARSSLETTDDLFEGNRDVSDDDVLKFRSRRGEWIEKFDRILKEQFARRLAGTRRKGRRLDTDISAATLRVLTAFDFEKQAAITRATQRLNWAARRELPALDLRVGLLLAEPAYRDIDNPFAPAYVLDAVGATSRALFPNPRVWRPVMECILVDITSAVSKLYISLNRFLADRHVLPEIKASLRARSELRPPDDSELLPLFTKMMHEVEAPKAGVALDVQVPDLGPAPAGAPGVPGVAGPPSAPGVPGALAGGGAASAAPAVAVPVTVPPEVANALYNVFAQFVARTAAAAAAAPADAAAAPAEGFSFPQLDSMMALGTSSALIAALERWQSFESHIDRAWHEAQPAGPSVPAPPLNRIPLIREAVADSIVNPTDRITMDVIALLFDYIFRDASIPESLRTTFARLQVPIAKAALLDRSFFSNKKHPARRLLDHLAAAAVGAGNDDAYRDTFEAIAAKIVDEIAEHFRIDVDVFESADAKLQPFVEAEREQTAKALTSDVAEALAAEQREADRSAVRVLLRDKLAGLDLPFEVRSFTETIWGDYLTTVRIEHGADSEAWASALRTLDDLLWSITAKERTAHKAKLTKMIPSLIRSLRGGCTVLKAGGERVQSFFEALYKLHIAALRPEKVADEAAADAAIAAAPAPIANLHDFVNEMVVGTWLAFHRDGGTVNARLFWISPMRTKYIFTSRARAQAFAFTPEELAYEIGAGKASLVVEPVPLFDRAVSAALDTLALQKPQAAAA